jgi:hypothetical protein
MCLCVDTIFSVISGPVLNWTGKKDGCFPNLTPCVDLLVLLKFSTQPLNLSSVFSKLRHISCVGTLLKSQFN